jgi:hypothetical protein
MRRCDLPAMRFLLTALRTAGTQEDQHSAATVARRSRLVLLHERAVEQPRLPVLAFVDRRAGAAQRRVRRSAAGEGMTSR